MNENYRQVDRPWEGHPQADDHPVPPSMIQCPQHVLIDADNVPIPTVSR